MFSFKFITLRSLLKNWWRKENGQRLSSCCCFLGPDAGNTLYDRDRCWPFLLATLLLLKKTFLAILYSLKSLFSCVVTNIPQCVSEANICRDLCAQFLRHSSLVKIILHEKPFDISWVRLNCILQRLQMV